MDNRKLNRRNFLLLLFVVAACIMGGRSIFGFFALLTGYETATTEVSAFAASEMYMMFLLFLVCEHTSLYANSIFSILSKFLYKLLFLFIIFFPFYVLKKVAKSLLKNSTKTYSLSNFLLTNIFIYFYFIAYSEGTIVCFYIISYIVYNYITTVYRSYGAHSKPFRIGIAIRVEQFISSASIAFIDSSWTEVAIV